MAGVGFGAESKRGQEKEPGGVQCALTGGSLALTSCLAGAHSFIQPVCLCVYCRGTLGSTLDTQPQLSPVTGRNALFFFFNFYLFILFYFFGCVGSSFLCEGFL